MIQYFNYSQKDVFYDTSIGKIRDTNEDSFGKDNTPNGYLFVVCDGMGGHVGGKEASKTAVEKILEYFQKKYENPQLALNEALDYANKSIFYTARDNPALKGMGTTACVLLLQDNLAWFAHVGDSRIYLYCHAEKRLHRITKDHSFVQTLVDKWENGEVGGIPDYAAENHAQKNIIMRALGIKEDMQPTISSVKPANGDIFLICSDGLTGMVNDSAIENVLSKADSTLQEKGAELMQMAWDNGGKDNTTIELIHISNSPNPNPKPNRDFTSYNPKTQKLHQKPRLDFSKTAELPEELKKKYFSKFKKLLSYKIFPLPAAIALVLVIVTGLFVILYNTSFIKEIRIEKLKIVEANEIKTIYNLVQDSTELVNNEKRWENQIMELTTQGNKEKEIRLYNDSIHQAESKKNNIRNKIQTHTRNLEKIKKKEEELIKKNNNESNNDRQKSK
jgi:serine/threonine protein phosphatase PrpC